MITLWNHLQLNSHLQESHVGYLFPECNFYKHHNYVRSVQQPVQEIDTKLMLVL